MMRRTPRSPRIRNRIRRFNDLMRSANDLPVSARARLLMVHGFLHRGAVQRAGAAVRRIRVRYPEARAPRIIDDAMRHAAASRTRGGSALRRVQARSARRAAYRAISEQRWRDALTLTLIAIDLNPASHWCRYLRSIACLRTGDPAAAADALLDALALGLRPQHAYAREIVEALLAEANRLRDQRRYVDAIAMAERATLVGPSSLMPLTLLASLFDRAGDMSGAVRTFDILLRRLPDSEHLKVRRRRIEGRKLTYDPAWLPDVPGDPEPLLPASSERVLHLLERTLPHRQSGSTVRTRYIVEAQRAIGLDPVVASRLGYPMLDDRIHRFEPMDEINGVEYHRLTRPEIERYALVPFDLYLRLYAREAARLVERERPAVLHPASSYGNALVALALRERYGIPVVYEIRGFPWEQWVERMGEEVEHYQLRVQAEARCMREADKVVTIAESMKQKIVSRYGIPEEHVVVVPNAVDHLQFAPRPRDEDLARSLGLDEGIVLGYISGLVPYEGVDILLRATAMLHARGVPVRCLVVGDGPELPELKRLVHDLGLGGIVRLPGRVPHSRVPDYYSLLDVFVVPRRNDAVCRSVTPLKPFEAMSMGVPLLVSDLPALQEIVAPDRGLTFTPEDPAALATEAERLIADPLLRARLAESAKTWVRRERTWHRNAERYRDVYAEVLERSGWPSYAAAANAPPIAAVGG